INLLSNAVKFTEQGAVDLRLERPDEASVSIAIADSGIGISLEDQAVLFQAFQQVGSSKARAQGGTGLGLAISRRLAELIDGTLTVNSQPGRGSIFTLRLPARYRPPTLDDGTDQTEPHETSRWWCTRSSTTPNAPSGWAPTSSSSSQPRRPAFGRHCGESSTRVVRRRRVNPPDAPSRPAAADPRGTTILVVDDKE